ncbi:hypothetical protein EPUL_000180 [Erysiphe pulchra]|uniref:Uncharacterized protein n=1 Tax=Erysiphe pulchra TaxID=225359 RepID=A0A2S4Q1L3_9PEZI|nr:hypothetical protein EPUL_000180 [Erysiphe pulchra]
MAPPACDKKRDFSETLDPKSHVQKSANNAGRAQPRAITLTRSVEKANVVVSKIATVQESLAVASLSTQPSVSTMDIDTECQDTTCSQKEDVPAQNVKLMIKPGDLLNLVGPCLKEMEIECSSAGTGFLALTNEGVSRATGGEKMFLRTIDDPHKTQTTQDKSKASWVPRAANGNNISRNNPIRPSPPRSSPPQGRSLQDRGIMIHFRKDHEARKIDFLLL